MIQKITLVILFFSYSSAMALEKVQFTNVELGAVFTLLRPELNSIELQGRTLIFEPAPSVKFLGAQRSETYIDLSKIGNIADIEFNHIKSKMPEIKFGDNAFELKVPVEDQERAVKSILGSISFKDVVLSAKLIWQTKTDGYQVLEVQDISFEGNLRGSGVLRSSYLLFKMRELLVGLMTSSLKKFLATEKVQNAIASGLLSYSKFYTGNEAKEIIPSSIQFIKTGIKYEVN